MPWNCMRPLNLSRSRDRRNLEYYCISKHNNCFMSLLEHCSWKLPNLNLFLLAICPREGERAAQITHRNCFISNNKLQWIRNLFDFISRCFSLHFACCLSKNAKPRNCWSSWLQSVVIISPAYCFQAKELSKFMKLMVTWNLRLTFKCS